MRRAPSALLFKEHMSDTKLNTEERQLLAEQLVATVEAELVLTEDEQIELFDQFLEVLEDMFASRG